MASRRRLAIAMLAAIASTAVIAAIAAPSASTRAAGCNPVQAGIPPNYGDHTSEGWGIYACTSGSAYDFTVRLVNRAGSALISRSGSFVGQSTQYTPRVTCTGAYVHSFAYQNYGGSGSSDSSSDWLC